MMLGGEVLIDRWQLIRHDQHFSDGAWAGSKAAGRSLRGPALMGCYWTLLLWEPLAWFASCFGNFWEGSVQSQKSSVDLAGRVGISMFLRLAIP